MIRIPYGQTALPPGTRLPVVSRNAAVVNVRYLEQVYPTRVNSTQGQSDKRREAEHSRMLVSRGKRLTRPLP